MELLGNKIVEHTIAVYNTITTQVNSLCSLPATGRDIPRNSLLLKRLPKFVLLNFDKI